MAVRSRGPTRGMLQPHCEVQPVQNSTRLQSYFNAARNVLLQGESYLGDGDLQQAYVYIKRFMMLALQVIPSHNAYKQTVYQKDRAWLAKERERVLNVLDSIAFRLDEEDAARALQEAEARRTNRTNNNKNATAPGKNNTTVSTGDWWNNLPEVPTGAPKLPTKNGTTRVTNPSAPPAVAPYRPAQPPSYQESVTGSTVVPSAPPAPEGYGDPDGEGAGERSSMGIGVRSGVEAGSAALTEAFRTLSLDQGGPAEGHYPSVGAPRYQRERPSLRTTKSVVGAKRRMILPMNLVEVFERIARPNTSRSPYGIETCGILAGKMTHNVLEMTTLIIPKQEGTSDSCATTDETQLFNHMLANKLITLGWIHTHPMQGRIISQEKIAFIMMSLSVDMHTHCGYQLMLPEAVAVVYAPCDDRKRIGVFRLTQPGGMKLIQECKLKGFHVHPDNVVIYEDAKLDWAGGNRMAVVDLR